MLLMNSRRTAWCHLCADDDQLVLDSTPALQAAGVPIFAAATSTAFKGGGLLFRTRASEKWRATDLATTC